MALPLRVCQFNVLAPSLRICAPLDTIPWQQRHAAICDELLRLDPDVICLQEFDFAPSTKGFAELYQARLGSAYEFHLKKRTRGKPEGLAMLLRKCAFEDIAVQALELEPRFCDRVAQVATMRHRTSGLQLFVANTHLTVAHASNNHDIPFARPLQMEQVMNAILGAQSDSLVFLCADMNCDHLETEDPISKGLAPQYTAADVSQPVAMAFQEGLVSALHSVLSGARPVSHTSSYSQDGCADYIFFRPQADLDLDGAFLHPAEVHPDMQWSAITGWGDLASTLSDHRPLLADFRLWPKQVNEKKRKNAPPEETCC